MMMETGLSSSPANMMSRCRLRICTALCNDMAAQHFGVSKSTVHKDIAFRLRQLNPALYHAARAVLDKNKQERHIRGGLATKRKYARL